MNKAPSTQLRKKLADPAANGLDLAMRGMSARCWKDVRIVVTGANLIVRLDEKTGHGAAYRLNSRGRFSYVGARDRANYPGIWS